MSLESVFARPPPLVGVDLDGKPKDSEKSTLDLEEGELEDGELEDDDQGAPPDVAAPYNDGGAETGRVSGRGEEGEVGNEDGHRNRGKRKRHERKKHGRDQDKKRHKKKKYQDYDSVQDEGPQADWQQQHQGGFGSGGGGGGGSSGGGGGFGSPHHHHHHRNRGGRNDMSEQHDSNKSPPGPYGNSPYRSPPGPYDSPAQSDDEYGPPPKLHRLGGGEDYGTGGGSMLSMLDDGYMDANVAANEQQEMFNKSRPGGPSQRRREKTQRFFEMKRQREEERQQGGQHGHQQGGHHGHQRGGRRRAMCRFWHEGSCRQGDNCQYSHEGPMPKMKRQLKLCKYFLNSICTKGSDCIFMHGDFPCKYYHKEGNCKEGSQCRFSHQPLNDVTRGILDRLDQEQHGDQMQEQRDDDNFNSSPPKKSLLDRRNRELQDHEQSSPPRHLRFYGSMSPNHQGGPPNQFPPNQFSGPHSQNMPPQHQQQHSNMDTNEPQRPTTPEDSHDFNETGSNNSGSSPPPQRQQPQHQQGPPSSQSATISNNSPAPPKKIPSLLEMNIPKPPPRPPMPPNMMPPRPGFPPGGPPPPGMPPPRMPPGMPPRTGLLGHMPPPPPGMMGMPPPPMGPPPPGMMGMPPPSSTAQAAEFLNILAMTLKQGGGGDNNQQPPDQPTNENNQPQTSTAPMPSMPPTSDPDFLNKLNPKQRDLFHRMQQGGGGGGIDSTANMPGGSEVEDQNWYSSDEDENKQGGGNNYDINNMLSSLRKTASAPPSGPPVVRDPRVSLSQSNSLQGDPRSDPRSDPRTDPRTASANNATPAQPPQPPPVMKSNLKKQGSKDNTEIYINGSQSVAGSVPYLLYTVTKDSKPTLPHGVDPDNPPFEGDPRLKKYQKPKPTLPDITSPLPQKLTTLPMFSPSVKTETAPPDPRVRKRLETEDSNTEQQIIKMDNSLPASSPVRSDSTDSSLPKMLDPRYLRQISSGSDKKDVLSGLGGSAEVSKPATNPMPSPSASTANMNKPAFSHRNDPRFKKKHRDSIPGASSSTVTGEKSDKETDNSSSETDTPQQTNRMEFASPLGNLEDTKDVDQYGAYGRPDRSRNTGKIVQYPAPQDTGKIVQYPAPQDPQADQPAYGMANEGEPSTEGEENVREMFTSIDPTASPFC